MQATLGACIPLQSRATCPFAKMKWLCKTCLTLTQKQVLVITGTVMLGKTWMLLFGKGVGQYWKLVHQPLPQTVVKRLITELVPVLRFGVGLPFFEIAPLGHPSTMPGLACSTRFKYEMIDITGDMLDGQ
jgi:hypothetical protein